VLSVITLKLVSIVILDSSLMRLLVHALFALITVLYAQIAKPVRYVMQALHLTQLHSNVLRVVMITCILILLMVNVTTVWLIVTCVMMVKLVILAQQVICILIMILPMQTSIPHSLMLLTISANSFLAMLVNSLTMICLNA